MSMLSENATPHWYVVHTYSGYENRLATNLEKIVENRKMGHLILAVKIPTEKVVSPDGDNKEEERKLFPSYVLVKMVMNDETWHVVRNIRGVTGFVGPGSRPIPLTDEEVAEIGIEKYVINLAYEVGDSVKIIGGPLAGFVGTVEEISADKKKIKVIATIFGRETPVELDSDAVKLNEIK